MSTLADWDECAPQTTHLFDITIEQLHTQHIQPNIDAHIAIDRLAQAITEYNLQERTHP